MVVVVVGRSKLWLLAVGLLSCAPVHHELHARVEPRESTFAAFIAALVRADAGLDGHAPDETIGRIPTSLRMPPVPTEDEIRASKFHGSRSGYGIGGGGRRGIGRTHETEATTYASTSRTVGPMIPYELAYEGIEAGTICFARSTDPSAPDSLATSEFAVEALAGLDAVKTRMLWPSTGSRLAWSPGARELCGFAPAISMATTHLAVLIRARPRLGDIPREPSGAHEGLLLWTLADGPRSPR